MMFMIDEINVMITGKLVIVESIDNEIYWKIQIKSDSYVAMLQQSLLQ